MLPNKFRWIMPLCVILLAVMACGQFSVGVITPTAVNAPGETPTARTLVPTSVSTTPTPVSSPTSDWDPAAATAVPEASIPALTYLGPDSNVWVLEAGSETPRQVTFDANLMGSDSAAVEYGYPRLSSDGTLLAYSREVGTPVASGFDFTTGLWVTNLTTGEQRQIMDGRPAGMAWKPGSHLLSYGTAVDGNYFITRGEPDSTLANGISAIDLDSGETLELVAPERGYALSSPKWSPDGHFLAFTEVFNMEGSGLFAY